jgi:hypothetical protein
MILTGWIYMVFENGSEINISTLWPDKPRVLAAFQQQKMHNRETTEKVP